MDIIDYKGEKCAVIPITAWNILKEKVLAQRQLIEEYQMELEKL